MTNSPIFRVTDNSSSKWPNWSRMGRKTGPRIVNLCHTIQPSWKLSVEQLAPPLTLYGPIMPSKSRIWQTGPEQRSWRFDIIKRCANWRMHRLGVAWFELVVKKLNRKWCAHSRTRSTRRRLTRSGWIDSMRQMSVSKVSCAVPYSCTRLSFRMIGLNSVSEHDYKSFFHTIFDYFMILVTLVTECPHF